jgi:hypothetical protein
MGSILGQRLEGDLVAPWNAKIPRAFAILSPLGTDDPDFLAVLTQGFQGLRVRPESWFARFSESPLAKTRHVRRSSAWRLAFGVRR